VAAKLAPTGMAAAALASSAAEAIASPVIVAGSLLAHSAADGGSLGAGSPHQQPPSRQQPASGRGGRRRGTELRRQQRRVPSPPTQAPLIKPALSSDSRPPEAPPSPCSWPAMETPSPEGLAPLVLASPSSGLVWRGAVATAAPGAGGFAQTFGAWSSGDVVAYTSEVGDRDAPMPPWVETVDGAAAIAAAPAEARGQQRWLREAPCASLMDYGEYDYGDMYGDYSAESYRSRMREQDCEASGSARPAQSHGVALKASMQQWDRYVDNDTLEELGPDKASALLTSCSSQVWELSKSARYCRLVQHALELADEHGQLSLVSELKTRVIEATMDPHANHVLQRAVELMRPGAIRFVLEELMQHKRGVSDLAKHRYGCRVVERLIEHFPPQELAAMVSEMLADAKSLSGHPFANFVMQHLLEHGEQAQRKQLVIAISSSAEDLRWLAAHQYACSVLDKALSYCPVDDQRALAKKVLDISGLLPEMAVQRGGFAATQRLFKVIGDEPSLLAKAKLQLTQRASELVGSKHGRALAAQIYPELLERQPVIALPSPSRAPRQGGGTRGSGGGHRGGWGAGRSAAHSGRGFDPGGRA